VHRPFAPQGKPFARTQGGQECLCHGLVRPVDHPADAERDIVLRRLRSRRSEIVAGFKADGVEVVEAQIQAAAEVHGVARPEHARIVQIGEGEEAAVVVQSPGGDVIGGKNRGAGPGP
jgi:hypothetical protein